MGICWIGYRRDEAAARRLLADDDELDALLESDYDQTTALDLDKAWHGVHWLLTGSAEPTTAVGSDAISGGEPLGDDLGFGPPRLLGAAQVAAVAEFLARTPTTTLRARFDPAAMTAAEIYPTLWNWDEAEIFDDFLAPSVDALREFYSGAAAANEAVIQILY